MKQQLGLSIFFLSLYILNVKQYQSFLTCFPQTRILFIWSWHFQYDTFFSEKLINWGCLLSYMMYTEFMTRVYLKLVTKSNQPQEYWHHEKDRILVVKWHSSVIAYNRFIRLKGIDSYKLHKSRLMLNTVLKNIIFNGTTWKFIWENLQN